nr:hypothetical protein [Mycolicibacterium komanii]CRL76706.1 hypothetical protein CPGR_04576 [Mycolicibacterium komanii]
MGVRKTFNDFKRLKRIGLLTSLVVGVLLLTALTLTDFGVNVTIGSWDPKPEWLRQFDAEWFNSHAYIPNILAAITGFLIGVPIALVVLATFTDEREERAKTSRVDRQSAVAWIQFRNAGVRFANIDRIASLIDTTERVQQAHDEAISILQHYRETMPDLANRLLEDPEDRENRMDTFNSTVSTVISHSHKWLQLLEEVDSAMGSRRAVHAQWLMVLTHWATLDQYIRLQRLEIGQPLFEDDERTAYLRDFLSGNHPNPLAEFLDAQEDDTNATHDNMAAACHKFWRYAELSLPLFELRCGRTAGKDIEFPHIPVKNYRNKATTAANALTSLRRHISMLEINDWPKNARELVPDMVFEEDN